MIQRSFIALLVIVPLSLASLPALALEPPPQWYVMRYSGGQIAVAPRAPQLNLGAEFTMEAWVYLENHGRYTWLLGKANATTNWAYAFMLSGDGSGRVQLIQCKGEPGENCGVVTSPEAFPLRTWTHLAGTLEGGTLRLFIDGVEVGQAPSPGPPVLEPMPFGVGGVYTDSHGAWVNFSGAMRQVRVWGRALSAGELKANAVKWLEGSEPDLLAYWPLDDGKGQTAHELGPNHLPLQRGLDAAPDGNDPGWIHTAIVDQGPFFALEGPLEIMPACGPDPAAPCLLINGSAAIDFDHDGNLDVLLTTTFFNSNLIYPRAPVVALHNDGDGHFTDVTASVCPGVYTHCNGRFGLVSDYNGDGLSDVFFEDQGPDHASGPGGQNLLLFQTSDGRMEDVTTTHLPLRNVFTHAACAGDFDGDGLDDIFVAPIYTGSLPDAMLATGPRLLRNDGHGFFSRGTEGLPYSVLRQTNNVGCTAIDANRDGHLDLVIGGGVWEKRDTLLLNDGHGNLTLAPESALPLRGPSPIYWNSQGHHMTSADLDGDAWPDLLYYVPGTDGSTRWCLFLNNRNGTFRDAGSRIVFDPEAGHSGMWPRIADLNGDGKLDFVIAGGSRLFLNNGASRYLDSHEFLPLNLPGANLEPGDFDGNGSVDVLLVSGMGSSIRLLRQLKAPDLALLAPAPTPVHRHLPPSHP
jgi:hypothetical protein